MSLSCRFCVYLLFVSCRWQFLLVILPAVFTIKTGTLHPLPEFERSSRCESKAETLPGSHALPHLPPSQLRVTRWCDPSNYASSELQVILVLSRLRTSRSARSFSTVPSRSPRAELLLACFQYALACRKLLTLRRFDSTATCAALQALLQGLGVQSSGLEGPHKAHHERLLILENTRPHRVTRPAASDDLAPAPATRFKGLLKISSRPLLNSQDSKGCELSTDHHSANLSQLSQLGVLTLCICNLKAHAGKRQTVMLTQLHASSYAATRSSSQTSDSMSPQWVVEPKASGCFQNQGRQGPTGTSQDVAACRRTYRKTSQGHGRLH